MFLEIASAAYLLGQYAYHRWYEDHPKQSSVVTVDIPTVKPGTALPMFFGKVRIRQPILTWWGYPKIVAAADTGGLAGDAPYLYAADFIYALGIPFQDGVNRVHGMWAGDRKLGWLDFVGMTGDGEFEQMIIAETTGGLGGDAGFIGGQVEFVNGSSTQRLVDDVNFPFPATTEIGRRLRLSLPGGVVPGMRGVVSVGLFNGGPFDPVAGPQFAWWIGPTAMVPAFNFEASTYPNHSLDALKIGEDANPADVLWAIYRDTYGKLGLDYTRVDYETFRACAEQLKIEGHGFSRVWENGEAPEAGDIILEILKQIDGLIYLDELDGLIKLRLIRPDFDPASLRTIDPTNARLEPVTAAGRAWLTNKMRILFENRANGYQPDDATADNGANAVGQDGAQRPEELEFLGIKVKATAQAVATRELAARSTPLSKFRAIVDRREYRAVPGDRFVVNWPKWNIAGRVMIVARVSKGAANSNDIALDLIQDFHFTHRFLVSPDDGFPHHGSVA